MSRFWSCCSNGADDDAFHPTNFSNDQEVYEGNLQQNSHQAHSDRARDVHTASELVDSTASTQPSTEVVYASGDQATEARKNGIQDDKAQDGNTDESSEVLSVERVYA